MLENRSANHARTASVSTVKTKMKLKTTTGHFFSLWKSKFFHSFLCGSVIDMLRISDLKKILIEKVQPNFENFEKNEILIERLKTVEKLNSEYSRRVQVLEKLRHQLIYHFYFVK